MDSKKLYACSLPLTPEVILSFVSSQVASLMQSYKEHELYVSTTVIIPLTILYMNARSFVDLGLPLPLLNFLPAKNVWIYIETAIVVAISYVSLLIVSWSYIWLAVFPLIATGFIVALCKELSLTDQDQAGGSHSQEQQSKESEGEGEGEGEATAASGSEKKAEELEAVALVPYWALCVMGHFHADRFAVSQFLLFFSFMLAALTMMMTRLVALTTAHRGIGPASELLRKASLVVLLVAVHAVAAELLGENALLYCLPEIVPVLLWLSVRLDCDDDRAITVTATAADRMTWLEEGSGVLNLLGAAAVVAAMLAVDFTDESVLYWCSKALVSCAVSALLTLCNVFVLCQWPGEQGDGTLVVTGTAAALMQEVAVLLLKYWAKFLLAAAAMLLVSTSFGSLQLVLRQEPVSNPFKKKEPVSNDHILQRLCQKFLQFII